MKKKAKGHKEAETAINVTEEIVSKVNIGEVLLFVRFLKITVSSSAEEGLGYCSQFMATY